LKKKLLKTLCLLLVVTSLFSLTGCASEQQRYERAVSALEKGDFARAEKLLADVEENADAIRLKKKMTSPMENVSDSLYYYGTQLVQEFETEDYRKNLGNALYKSFNENHTGSSLAEIIIAIRKAPLLNVEYGRITALEKYVKTETDALYLQALETYWKFLCDASFDEACARLNGEAVGLCATNFSVRAGILGLNITLDNTLSSLSFMLTSLDQITASAGLLESLTALYTVYAA